MFTSLCNFDRICNQRKKNLTPINFRTLNQLIFSLSSKKTLNYNNNTNLQLQRIYYR